MHEAMTPSEQGARTEAAVASALIRTGAHVYLPSFGNGRIDLIYERAGQLIRVQCKSASLVGDTLRFRTCSNTGQSPSTYDGEIDEFGVYSSDTNSVYMVPIDGLPTRAGFLRLTAPRNGQRAGIRWASDFDIGPP